APRSMYEISEQLFALAQRLGDRLLFLEAHHGLGVSLCFLGELSAAYGHLGQAMALYNPQQRAQAAADSRVACLCYMAFTLWLLGYPDQSLQKSREALALARDMAQPFDTVFACVYAARLHQLRREKRETQARAEEAIALSTAHGFPTYQALGAEH